MSEQLVSGVVTVLTAIIGVAIIAVLVSRNANTSGVIQAGGGAFTSALQAATGPVTGQGGGSLLGSGMPLPTGGLAPGYPTIG